MLNPLVSIYTLIYNSENYLDSSINSIINQSYKNLEILLIVNGKSCDNSELIAKKYAEKDYRIKLIYNLGPDTSISGGRRLALDCLTGNYFTDLDHDDILPETAIEECVDIISKAGAQIVVGNIVFCERSKITALNSTKKTGVYQVYDTDAYFRKMLSEENFFMHGKMYDSTLYKNNEITIFENLRCGEDGLIDFQLTMNSARVATLADTVYYWISNPQSSTQNLSVADHFNNFRIMEFMSKKLELSRFYNEEIKYLFTAKRLTRLCNGLYKTNGRVYRKNKEEIATLLNGRNLLNKKIYNFISVNKRYKILLYAFYFNAYLGTVMSYLIRWYDGHRQNS
jgi:glycosyltransferase involved in cell wall biosynthesis